MKKIKIFNYSWLLPRFWLIWIGISILYILVLLPYPVIYYIGTRIGRVAKYFMLRRSKIIQKNLELCFPEFTNQEKHKLLEKNFESIGMGIFEIGMAWFWPEHRVKRWFKIYGFENIKHVLQKNQGVLLIGIHFLTLELGARIFGILHPGIGVYRPHNNPLLDWLQTKGRLKSNKSMINRSNIKKVITALKHNEIVWYAPDHDYGRKNSVFAPLFKVSNAASTIGTYILIKIANPAIISFVPRRLPHALGYELLILPNYQNKISSKTCIDTVISINRLIEQLILLAPEQYMWLHRRFKTRPFGESSPY